MRFSRLAARIALHWSRPVLGVLLCCAYIVAEIGVPLPTRVVKDRSQPFACMDRACGCMSAAQCAMACCCSKGLESPKAARPCCAARAKQSARAACEATVHRAASHERGSPVDEGAAFTITLLRHCGGLGLSLSLSDLAVAPPPRVHWTFDSSLSRELLVLLNQARAVVHSPDVPPPRSAARV